MFGDLVRRHRERLQMTQEGLAARTGLGVRTVRDIEAGRTASPRRRTVNLLADALGFADVEREELQRAGTGAADTGGAGPAGASPGNLPHETSSFIGRARQLQDVDRLLAKARLVTLVGVGGVGKTRLARHAAHAAGPAHGVWLVDLAPAGDPSLVVPSIAEALDVRDHGNRDLLAAVQERILDQELLLLIDNCEHLAGRCALVVERLLAGCPRLRVLATSREPLKLAGEHILVVPPLCLAQANEANEDAGDAGDAAAGDSPGARPAGDCEALRLFKDRAEAAAGRALPPGSDERALELCRRLAGIPLAIEVAAVRLRALALDDLLDRLDPRFDMLDAPTSHPARHPTLRAALDWSYRLCTPPEQQLWRRLSVFADPFELAAAMLVAGDADDHLPVEVLLGLVDKSIVSRDDRGCGTRYRLLEPIRQYGAEQLAAVEDPAARRDRHARVAG